MRVRATRVCPWLVGMLLSGWVLAGCQSSNAAPPPRTGVSVSTRNNCYSLLHQLLDEQKDVSLLRFVKKEDTDVTRLIKKIAAVSKAGAKLLEDYAQEDPGVVLGDIALPPGEVATRAAISAIKKKQLLGLKGKEQERALLLAQTEALSYGSSLARVAADNEIQTDRARALREMSDQMESLYDTAFGMLLYRGQ